MSARKPKPLNRREAELLAALQSLVADADADHWTEEDSSRRNVSVVNIERARAAIAKAVSR